ncbi:MAG: hypothetical protein LBB93_04925, partial [Elusimicrobiota bacterium]|nr:hypothetical protein [Elusimicrobiota bacterium]
MNISNCIYIKKSFISNKESKELEAPKSIISLLKRFCFFVVVGITVAFLLLIRSPLWAASWQDLSTAWGGSGTSFSLNTDITDFSGTLADLNRDFTITGGSSLAILSPKTGFNSAAFTLNTGNALTLTNVALQGFNTNSSAGPINITAGATLIIANTIAGTNLVFDKNKTASGQSNDIYVNSAAKPSIHLNAVAGSTISLLGGIQMSGGNLKLDTSPGRVILGGYNSFTTLASGININTASSSLEFLNATAVFNVGSGNRIQLTANNAELLITNSSVTFMNATYDNGQGMFISAASNGTTRHRVTIKNSYVRFDNSANPNHGGTYGAIAWRSGAGPYETTQSSFSITDSTVVFHGNRARVGGAYLVSGSAILAYVNSFITFSSNTSTADLGGAINMEHWAKLLIDGGKVIFSNNKTSGDGVTGGALAAKGSTINFINTEVTFNNNESGSFGGALDLKRGDSTIGSYGSFENSKVTFIGNTTKLHGGAVSVRNSGYLMIMGNKTRVFVLNNQAGDGYGGGFYVGYGGDNQQSNTNTITLSITSGAIVHFEGNFLPGTGGGGAYFGQYANINVTQATMTFVKNSASLDGGGIYWGSNVTGNIVDSYIDLDSNVSKLNGGAMSLSRGPTAVTNPPTAETDGTSNVMFYNSTLKVINNQSGTGYGGGIYIANPGQTTNNTKNLYLTNMTSAYFEGNRLVGAGGAIYVGEAG